MRGKNGFVAKAGLFFLSVLQNTPVLILTISTDFHTCIQHSHMHCAQWPLGGQENLMTGYNTQFIIRIKIYWNHLFIFVTMTVISHWLSCTKIQSDFYFILSHLLKINGAKLMNLHILALAIYKSIHIFLNAQISGTHVKQ